MTSEPYPLLTYLGVRIVRDDPDSPPGVDYRKIDAAIERMSLPKQYRWERFKDGCTCGRNGAYADDVERFLWRLRR